MDDQTPHLKQIPTSDEIQGGRELMAKAEPWVIGRLTKEWHEAGLYADLSDAERMRLAEAYATGVFTVGVYQRMERGEA